MWHEYTNAKSIEQVIQILGDKKERARVVAGGTDLILELERGVRKGLDTLIDITRIPKLDQITMDEDDIIHLGALVTHNDCAGSKLIRTRAYPLARAAWEVGAPQIRNRGTVAGNLITASPANDTITPLMALGASVTLLSTRGERIIPLSEFYTGVRKSVMQADEMLVDISFPALKDTQRGTFIKLALRRAQAISLVNAAIILNLKDNTVRSASITLGAVTPIITHAVEAENFLLRKKLNEKNIAHAAELAMQAARPIDDVRGSAAYRREMVRIITMRGLTAIRDGNEQEGMPKKPILLAGKKWKSESATQMAADTFPEKAIETTINGKSYSFNSGHNKTLLRLLREEGMLTGTKEGCAEGECGACTIFLDGKAVMACLVPAPRAHGAEITTVEGLSNGSKLHPVQTAFIEHGAVQCGYCTPGFIMSGAKLLEEKSNPTHNEIEQALTGNLCRCTGYYKIVKAVEDAGQKKSN
ncbi:FAD binding domain-containing protein [Candidatus Villigracilis saccharophilus]|uniref:FAD binding domain-containing protein n=1 Tax=Candidatus Villigracilis saccharophilus TaxID=3140684 RepID=UPI003136B49F|nr:FAD binding domain-containing protein [Anaerolineales bacterium]